MEVAKINTTGTLFYHFMMRAIPFMALLNAITIIQAQDMITTREGEDILGRVIEVGDDAVIYKKLSNPDGPLYSIKKSSLLMIRYENGEKDIFVDKSEPEENDDIEFVKSGNSPTENLSLKGWDDGQTFYHRHVAAGTTTLIISLLSPLIGLIPAIACSSTPPSTRNLGCPYPDRMQDPGYAMSYRMSAKKKKQRKVWANWGIAFGVNLALVLALSGG